MISGSIKMPALVTGAAIFYWSWTIELWSLGLVMAIAVESPRWVSWRLDLREKHFIQLSNFTAIVFAVTGIVLFFTHLHESLFIVVQWLPLIFFPLVLAQRYSHTQHIPLQAIIASLRRREHILENFKKIDIVPSYFLTTVLAASINGIDTRFFYIVLSLLLFWFLWNMRPNQQRKFLWLSFATVIFAIGWIFHMGIFQLAGTVQAYSASWFYGDWSNRNTDRTTTAIGQLGKLKLSEKIAMRIHNSYGSEVLLQQATYNRFFGNIWHSTDRQFKFLHDSYTDGFYELSSQIPDTGGTLSISTSLASREGTLAIPMGSYGIKYSGEGKLSKNRTGMVKLHDAAERLEFKVNYRKDFVPRYKPDSQDLEIPPVYRKIMHKIASELDLKNLPEEEAANTLKRYFENNFNYTLVQDNPDIQVKPLQLFLTKSREGHCEYFATTGALILRAAGIPTRYATGYLMSEYDPDENLFIVRNRHAHAWTLAFINDRWIELDFTPSNWVALEANNAPYWRPVYDTISHWLFNLSGWWKSDNPSLLSYGFAGILIIVCLIIINKFNRSAIKLQWKRINKMNKKPDYDGADSPFYSLANKLEEISPRDKSETFRQWVNRINASTPVDLTSINDILHLHYQYRFSKKSTGSLRTELQVAVNCWLQEYGHKIGAMNKNA